LGDFVGAKGYQGHLQILIIMVQTQKKVPPETGRTL